ncbi:hypothetical protein F5Y12DRAFT_714309 [Xylaria sp. FL1777]|nr:hypothetical protein F5Y12DRAFT_714309 [Xylaria sp. FL1777]
MPDSLGEGDGKPDPARPSFTGFWKRSKDEQAAQNLTFVSSKLGQPSAQGEDDAQAEPLAAAKANARRQQVRNAQRQHRQRKANYTKQLELDITKLRDDISKVEQELESLRSQNGDIRSQLARGDQPAVAEPVESLPVNVADMAFSTSLAPNYIVSLDMFENLGTPAYQISRSSPSLPDTSSVKAASTHATETLSSATPASTVGTSLEDVALMEMTLSEEQIDQAINFILALEHCCWNHVEQSCFEHHNHHQQQQREQQQQQEQGPRPPCSNKNLNGHTLMATTLALQSAPPSVFTRMRDLQQQLDASITTTTTTTSSSPPPPPPPATTTAAGTQQVAWSSRALTLTNLRRLAGTLNAAGAAELAPVQAWFELASLYGVGVATDGVILGRLRSELAGDVHCVMFGAAVQRDVFEAALKRVVGFLPPTWSPPPVRVVDDEEEVEEGGGEGEGEGEGMMDMMDLMNMDDDEEEDMEEMMMMMDMGIPNTLES